MQSKERSDGRAVGGHGRGDSLSSDRQFVGNSLLVERVNPRSWEMAVRQTTALAGNNVRWLALVGPSSVSVGSFLLPRPS
jgi:hypothetical protein